MGWLDRLLALGAWLDAALAAGRHPWDVLEEASAALGLAFEPPEGGTLPRAAGTVGGRRVVLDTDGASGGYVVEVTTGHPATLRGHSAWRDGGAAGVGTGDAAFDAVVVIESATGERRRHSAEGRWASSLDPAQRSALQALVARRGLHEHGRWTVPLALHDAGEVVAQVREVLAVADAMRTAEPPVALRARATTDPSEGVRALAADRLVTWLAAQKTRDAALLAALERELPDLARARVARLRGWVGADTLRALLAHADPAVVTEAALGLDAVGEPAEAALLAALPHGDVRVVQALAVSGTVAAVPALRALTAPDLVDAARAAVRAIQNRAVGAERGAISLVDPGAAGGLSEADAADAGGLSPPKDR